MVIFSAVLAVHAGPSQENRVCPKAAVRKGRGRPLHALRKEIAAAYELNFKMLVEQYDTLLMVRIIGIEYDDDLALSPATVTRPSHRLLGR